MENEIGGLKEVARASREGKERAERMVKVAEREVGFLQALNVGVHLVHSIPSRVDLVFQASYAAEQAQNAPEGSTGPSEADVQRLSQRIEQLEDVLAEYKATIDALTKELDAAGGGDPRDLGSGKSRKTLLEEVEKERVAREGAEQGMFLDTFSSGHLSILSFFL